MLRHSIRFLCFCKLNQVQRHGMHVKLKNSSWCEAIKMQKLCSSCLMFAWPGRRGFGCFQFPSRSCISRWQFDWHASGSGRQAGQVCLCAEDCAPHTCLVALHTCRATIISFISKHINTWYLFLHTFPYTFLGTLDTSSRTQAAPYTWHTASIPFPYTYQNLLTASPSWPIPPSPPHHPRLPSLTLSFSLILSVTLSFNGRRLHFFSSHSIFLLCFPVLLLPCLFLRHVTSAPISFPCSVYSHFVSIYISSSSRIPAFSCQTFLLSAFPLVCNFSPLVICLLFSPFTHHSLVVHHLSPSLILFLSPLSCSLLTPFPVTVRFYSAPVPVFHSLPLFSYSVLPLVLVIFC